MRGVSALMISGVWISEDGEELMSTEHAGVMLRVCVCSSCSAIFTALIHATDLAEAAHLTGFSASFVSLMSSLMSSLCFLRRSTSGHQLGRLYSQLTERWWQALQDGFPSSHFFRRSRHVKHPVRERRCVLCSCFVLVSLLSLWVFGDAMQPEPAVLRFAVPLRGEEEAISTRVLVCHWRDVSHSSGIKTVEAVEFFQKRMKEKANSTCRFWPAEPNKV